MSLPDFKVGFGFIFLMKALKENGKEDSKIFKICDVTTEKEITTYKYCLISQSQFHARSKFNQTMKLDQLTEYNMRNIFLRKSNLKFVAETIATPIYTKSNLSISLDQQSEMLYSQFKFDVRFSSLPNVDTTSELGVEITLKKCCAPLMQWFFNVSEMVKYFLKYINHSTGNKLLKSFANNSTYCNKRW